MPSELPPAPQQQAPAPQPDAAPAPMPSPEGLPPAPEGMPTDDSDLDGPDTEDDVDHYLGKLTYKISQTPEEELSDNKIKGILNSVISSLPLERLSPEERLVLAKRVKRGGQKDGEESAPQPEQPQGEVAPEPSPEGLPPAPEEEPIQEDLNSNFGIGFKFKSKIGEKEIINTVVGINPDGKLKVSVPSVWNDGKDNIGEIDPSTLQNGIDSGLFTTIEQPVYESEVCNPADEKKMNEFYSKIDKSKLVYENSKGERIGRDISRNTVLEIVMYPAELAFNYIKNQKS